MIICLDCLNYPNCERMAKYVSAKVELCDIVNKISDEKLKRLISVLCHGARKYKNKEILIEVPPRIGKYRNLILKPDKFDELVGFEKGYYILDNLLCLIKIFDYVTGLGFYSVNLKKLEDLIIIKEYNRNEVVELGNKLLKLGIEKAEIDSKLKMWMKKYEDIKIKEVI